MMRFYCALLYAISIGVATAIASEVIVDDPAIDVFPAHEQVGSEGYPLVKALADGRRLFKTKFNIRDGAGRPFATGDSKPTPRIRPGPAFNRIAGPDANSCWGCHNQPIVGGSGDMATNVFVGAHFSDPPVDSIAPRVTNERNTTTLFGTGAVEILAAEMTAELQSNRDLALKEAANSGSPIAATLKAKGVEFGTLVAHPNGYVDASRVEGIDFDLVIRPFGAKGITASLREFTIAALNHHHGIQAVERYGWERTGFKDFDKDGVEVEFTIGQLTALVLFQASLPIPNRNQRFDDSGFALFRRIGCAECHVPKMTLTTNIFREPNKYNRPGTLREGSQIAMMLDLPRGPEGWYIPVFSDLRRHRMCDEDIKFLCNEELKQDNVDLQLFMTARLWDLATSAPYCHRGNCTTLTEAILAHGGEARSASEKFRSLSTEEQRSLVRFLKSLGSDSATD